MEGEYAMPNVTDGAECPCPAPPEDKLSTGKGRQRLPHLGTHVQRVVDQPKVNTKASTPASRNAISNWRSTIGPGCRIN